MLSVLLAACSDIRGEVEIIDETQARVGFTVSLDKGQVVDAFFLDGEEGLDEWLRGFTNDLFQTDDYTLVEGLSIQNMELLYVIDYGVEYDYSVGTTKITFSNITVQDSIATIEAYSKPIIDTLFATVEETNPLTVEDLGDVFSAFSVTMKAPVGTVILGTNGSAHFDRSLVMWELADIIALYEQGTNPSVSFDFNTFSPPVEQEWWQVLLTTVESYFVNDPALAWGGAGLVFAVVASLVFLFGTLRGRKRTASEVFTDSEQDRLYAELNDDPEHRAWVEAARKRQVERLREADVEEPVVLSRKAERALRKAEKKNGGKKRSTFVPHGETASPVEVQSEGAGFKPVVITFKQPGE